MRVVTETTVEKEGSEVREPSDGWRNMGQVWVACREGGVIRQGSERERNDVEDIVFVGHALDSVPSATAHIRDVGGPIVPRGTHDIVNGFLLTGVGAGPILIY